MPEAYFCVIGTVILLSYICALAGFAHGAASYRDLRVRFVLLGALVATVSGSLGSSARG